MLAAGASRSAKLSITSSRLSARSQSGEVCSLLRARRAQQEEMFKLETHASRHLVLFFGILVASSALLVSVGCGGLASANSKAGSATAAGGSSTTPQISLSPAQLPFGTIAVNNSTTENVQITNSGSGTLTVSQLNLTGDNVFGVSAATLPLSIAAGQSATVPVAFSPTASGSFTGALAVSSNASNSSPTVTLSGNAAAAGSIHTVALNWSASSSSVAGYFVYRGTQSGGPYSRLIATADPATSYSDNSLQSGVTYYYVVTAINSNGAESPFSNEATAVVP